MLEMLIEYRYMIWTVGGVATYWLLVRIPSWLSVARRGTWNAERDYATWRLRNAFLALLLLVPLLVATTAVAVL
ncbi:MAG: hypothetical protein M3220_01135 [Chloroflexota bacterium]|nr:hypothetical protein [Chloroflexota bacterium]